MIIGTNGTGKSNLLEVLSAIFSALYEGKKNVEPDFRFELEYKIGSQASYPRKYPYSYGPNKVEVRNVDGVIEVKKNDNLIQKRNEILAVLPQKTIAVYSGEEKRLWEEYYFNSYEQYNKTWGSTPQKMVYINKYYWDLVVSVLYTSDIDNHRKFLAEQIGINEISKIELEFDVKNIKRNKNPIATEVLKILNPTSEAECEISIDKFQNIREIEHTHYDNDLFFILAVLILYKDYKIITSFKVIYNENMTVKNLSEGEKKLLLIYSAINLIDGDENLILFDEPDAHLHEGRKREICDLILEDNKRQIVITSHLPKLIKLFPANNEIFLRNADNKIEALTNCEFDILKEILDSDITFEEENAIKEGRKPLLLVEGKTDKKHLENAWRIIYNGNKMPFTIISLNGAEKIKSYINSVPDCYANQTIMGLVDNDNAGQKAIKNAEEIENHIYKHKNDGNQLRQAYTITIPYVDADLELFKYCPIEFLYPYDILIKYNVIEKKNIKEVTPIWIKDGRDALKNVEYENATNLYFHKVVNDNKNSFADHVIKEGIDVSKLDKFKELFEIIMKVMAYK